jgi:hypothetical protein
MDISISYQWKWLGIFGSVNNWQIPGILPAGQMATRVRAYFLLIQEAIINPAS